MASPSDEDGGDGDGNTMLTIHVSKSGKTLDVNLPQDALLSDLISSCEESGTWAASNDAHLDWDRAKFIAKGQLLRSGPDDHKTVSHLDGKRVTLQVPTTEDIQSLQQSSEAARARQARRQAQRRAAVPARQTRRQGDSNFTFLRIEPLPGLRNPERSREFLARLAEDPGIKAAMKKHQFTVGLLTEMDPLSNTQSSHEGTTRLLGLNRNAGEVIELRLRTDAYDGYRDYKTIRNTLCHELAHNVHGPHDRKFWDLCHQIEREVHAADWKHGGRSVGDAEFSPYEPSSAEEDEESAPDHGGWSGGTYVLGGSATPGAGGSPGAGTSAGTGAGADTQGLSRRDVIAKAAEERIKKTRGTKSEEPPDDGSDGGSRTRD